MNAGGTDPLMASSIVKTREASLLNVGTSQRPWRMAVEGCPVVGRTKGLYEVTSSAKWEKGKKNGES